MSGIILLPSEISKRTLCCNGRRGGKFKGAPQAGLELIEIPRDIKSDDTDVVQYWLHQVCVSEYRFAGSITFTNAENGCEINRKSSQELVNIIQFSCFVLK